MHKNQQFLLKNLITLLITAICLLAAVYAWFNSTKRATTDPLELTTVTTIGAQVATEYDGEYSGNAQFVMPFGLDLKEISGNGERFYLPIKSTQNGEPLINEADGTWVLAEDIDGGVYEPVANIDYIEHDLFFKSNMASKVYLDVDSFVLPVETDITAYPEKKSEFGNFSLDYIAGAVRVAFLSVDSAGAEELIFVWAPNSDYALIGSIASGYEMTFSDIDEIYRYYNGTALTEFAEGEFFTDIPNPLGGSENRFPISTLLLNEDGSFRAHIRIKIWVEGTDREAVSPLNGGQFKSSFRFLCIGDSLSPGGASGDISEETSELAGE